MERVDLVADSFYIQQDLVRWNGSYWATCNPGPRVWNQYFAHSWSTGYGWRSPPCGAGWHYQRTYAFDYLGNGAPSYANPNVLLS